MRLPRGLKILNGVTLALPPEILLRTFGTEVGEHVLDGDVDAQLRLCLCRPIFRGIAPSLAELSPYLRERVEHYVGLFKTVLRPILLECRMYHHTPFLPLTETTPWCVLEYAKPDRSAAAAVVFRTSCAAAGPDPDEFRFRPRGIDPARHYRVTLDNGGLTFGVSGRDLMLQGLPVRLEQPLASELLLFHADA
jgi:alpha-galactosidase